MKSLFFQARSQGQELRASAWGFFYRKSHINSVAIGTQAVRAIHPGCSGRGIPAFSRQRPLVAPSNA
jgi:hypothetical protein